ncbi:uncharacterized protein PRCAT00001640001 [Priceomyces carsonii]|uniref:uncharacterized protein n=1 Tax=Priceomyces carsonii TaxID=28549 RepID=UPI002ED85056|nr:unnamed protein product [Priceomyces carsonii]
MDGSRDTVGFLKVITFFSKEPRQSTSNSVVDEMITVSGHLTPFFAKVASCKTKPESLSLNHDSKFDTANQIHSPKLPNTIHPIYAKHIIKVGREPDICDIVISHATISLVHCLLWSIAFDSETPAIVYLKDVSKNGVYINGVLVGKGNTSMIQSNDIIEITKAIKMIYISIVNSDRLLRQRIQHWDITENVIGSGSYGSVYVAYKNNNPKCYAVKIIKERMKPDFNFGHTEKLRNEVEILMKTDHPNIIKLHDAFIIRDTLYMFEDLVCGGDLFSYLVQGTSLRPIGETETILIVFQLLKVLDYLHNDLNVVHRDLKLDNVLLLAPVPCTKIYLCDFGIAKCLKSPNLRASTLVGTVEYSAPEIFGTTSCSELPKHSSMILETNSFKTISSEVQDLNMGYDYKCDMWSLGIMIHIMLSGISPFYCDGNNINIIKTAGQGILNLDRPAFAGVSISAKNFITGLIRVNPENRFMAKDCFRQTWITRNRENLDRIYKEKILGFN